MKISKPVKILIGVLTLLVVLIPFVIMPAVMMFLVFGAGFPFLDSQAMPSPYDIGGPASGYDGFLSADDVQYFGQLGLQVFYVIHEIKNKAMTDTLRILFVLAHFFLPYIGMPIYFIAYLWKDRCKKRKLCRHPWKVRNSEFVRPRRR